MLSWIRDSAFDSGKTGTEKEASSQPSSPPPASTASGIDQCPETKLPVLLEQGASPDQDAKPNTEYPELDLVFICDCTGSMGSYIAAAQTNIKSIIERVVSSEKADVRFALVAYRDHPPEDTTYVTQVHPFTSDVEIMKGYVGTMSAAGGGDGPEAVTAGLHDALHLPWRAGATRISILIADAPPHGLEPHGDGFPNGDPFGRDPLAIAREMAVQEIACYTVGCEPALGDYYFARDFMCTLAEITGGQAVALSSASLLAEVIVNGSAEEISMTMLQREVEQEIYNVRQMAFDNGDALDDQTVCERATANLHARNVRSKQMRTDGGKMKNAHHSIWHKSEERSLASVKEELCTNVSVEPRGLSSAMSLSGGRRSRDARLSSRPEAVTASASIFGSVFRRTKTKNASRLEMASPEEEVEVAFRADTLCEAASMDRESSRGVMKKSELTEDLISMEQVSRIAVKSSHRKSKC